MIYDAVERAISKLEEGFLEELERLATEKKVDVQLRYTMYSRRPAEEWGPSAGEQKLPGLGVWGPQATTNTKSQGIRRSEVTVVIDYFATGPDASKLAAQCELAGEAIVSVLDGLPIGTNRGGVVEAGGAQGSILVDITGTSRTTIGNFFQEAVRVSLPVIDEDQVP